MLKSRSPSFPVEEHEERQLLFLDDRTIMQRLHIWKYSQFSSSWTNLRLPLMSLLSCVYYFHAAVRLDRYMLRKEEAPLFVACDTVITIRHILNKCDDLVEVRQKYFEERSLYSFFRKVIPEAVFDLLGVIGVLYKI